MLFIFWCCDVLSHLRSKGKKGSVRFKNTKGRLQIVFSYPVEVDGEVQRKRFYIATGFDDTPLNRQWVGDTVRAIQRDIDFALPPSA